MKIHILATPRSGATAYSLQLSKEMNLRFFNEPFKFANYYKKTKIGEFEFGGGIPVNASSYVSHHIASQYLIHYDPLNIPSDHKLIFIDRLDKWKQLKSYIAGVEMHKKYNGWHNLEYSTEKIVAKERFIQRLLHEWTVFDLFTARYPDIKVLYYEDLQFNEDSDIKKNTGSENLVFSNEKKIYDYYKIYMKNKPHLTISPMIDTERKL